MGAFHNSIAVHGTALAAVTLCLSALMLSSSMGRRPLESLEVSLPRHECKVPWRANVFVRFNAMAGHLERRVDLRDVNSDQEMIQAVREFTKGEDIPVGLDANPEVRWAEAIRLIEVLKENGFKRIDLLAPGGF